MDREVRDPGTTFSPKWSDPRDEDENQYRMSRPRFAALLSAVVASIAAFLTLKPWGLFGTLAGAALFPFVHTLVSHWSNKGIDQTVAAIRKRSGEGHAAAEEKQPSTPDPVDISEPPRREPSTPAWTRWLSIGLACVALGIGVYSMSLGSSADRVIVRERVIEREVASAVQLSTISAEPDGPGPDPDPMTITSTASTTSTTDGSAPGTDSSSTTPTGSADTVDSGGTTNGITPQDPESGNVSTVSTTGIGSGGQTTPSPTQTAP
jgi:hypothetical protein